MRTKTTCNYDNYADNVRNNIAKALELAKERLLNKKTRNKQYYDANTAGLELQIDDLVLVKSQVKKHKFQDVYEGPYRVLDIFDSYIEIMKGGKRTKIHKNLVKKSHAEHDREPQISRRIVDLDDLDDESTNKINVIYNINILNKIHKSSLHSCNDVRSTNQ